MRFDIKHIEIIDGSSAERDMAQIAQCHVEIGDPRTSGADIFVVDVCNLRWAEEHIYSDEATIYPSVLIVETINEKNIKKKIEEKFLNREYATFDELVRRAAPVMRWEFS